MLPPTTSPLRTEITALGWSAEQLISRINLARARRGQPPLNCKSAYPWLRGKRPYPETLNILLMVLADHGRAVTAADLGWAGPRTRRPRTTRPPTKARFDELRHEIEGLNMIGRRSLLLSAVVASVPAPDLLTVPTPARTLPIGGRHVSAQLAEHIDHSIRAVRAVDDTEGSAGAVQWAAGLWQSLAKTLTSSRYDHHTGDRLKASFLELSETYGWMLFDSGEHAHAQQVYQSGLLLAREAEAFPALDRAAVNLLASASYQKSWLGHHQDAVALLDAAARRAPHAMTPRLKAILADRALSAAGRQGDKARLHQAAAQAHDHLLNADDDLDPWWSRWLTHQAVDASTGSSWLAAGQPGRARPFLTERVTSPDPYPRDRLLAVIDLATAHLHARDLDEACASTELALEMASSVSSQRLGDRLAILVRDLARHRSDHSGVRAVLERAEQSPAT